MLITKHIQLIRNLTFGFFILFLHLSINGQEETVIDNKGNIIKVRNNVVTSNATAPTTPIEDDIWFNTTNQKTFVWNGSAWQEITHKGTTGSLFFASTSGEPTEDNTQLFWDDTNNRLGIGTNSPDNKLQVTGAIRSQGILNSNGNANEPSYRFSSDSNTGIFRPAADELGFSVGGVEALNIDETSSNTTVTVNETLELDGQVIDEDDSAGTAGQVLTATATGTKWSSSAFQLSQPGRGGAGNDDPGISYNSQTATSFEVIIGDNDNGGTDRSRFNSEFMFTVLDL